MENDCKHIPRIQLIQYMNLYECEQIISSKGLIDIITNN